MPIHLLFKLRSFAKKKKEKKKKGKKKERVRSRDLFQKKKED